MARKHPVPRTARLTTEELTGVPVREIPPPTSPQWKVGPSHRDYGQTPEPAPAPKPGELVACGACGKPRAYGQRCYVCLPRRWAREYDRCQNCGRTDSRHASGGLCRRCFQTRRHREGYHPPSYDRRPDAARKPGEDGVVRCRRCNAPVEPGKQCAPCRERSKAQRRTTAP